MAAVSKVRVCGRWLWHRMNAGSCLWRSALLQSTFWLANATLPDLTLPLLWLNLTVELFCRLLWKRGCLTSYYFRVYSTYNASWFSKKKDYGHPWKSWESEWPSWNGEMQPRLQIFLTFANISCFFAMRLLSDGDQFSSALHSIFEIIRIWDKNAVHIIVFGYAIGFFRLFIYWYM